MSNFKAHFDDGGFYHFGTISNLDKASAYLKDLTLVRIELNPIECGVLTPVTYNFLSLFTTLTVDIIDRLENGEFDSLLDEMEENH